MLANARNSGHFVQGHVDCTGTLMSKTTEGDSLWIKVRVPEQYIIYIVEKGFIAVDGTSLTVCEVNDSELWFSFMLVQYTQNHVVIPKREVGDAVNIEVDVLSKYVERSLRGIKDRLSAIEAKIHLESTGKEPASEPKAKRQKTES